MYCFDASLSGVWTNCLVVRGQFRLRMCERCFENSATDLGAVIARNRTETKGIGQGLFCNQDHNQNAGNTILETLEIKILFGGIPPDRLGIIVPLTLTVSPQFQHSWGTPAGLYNVIQPKPIHCLGSVHNIQF